MEHKLQPRRVIELPSKLTMFVNKRILIANELKDMVLTVESIENCDGTKPRLIIRIKKSVKKSVKQIGLHIPQRHR